VRGSASLTLAGRRAHGGKNLGSVGALGRAGARWLRGGCGLDRRRRRRIAIGRNDAGWRRRQRRGPMQRPTHGSQERQAELRRVRPRVSAERIVHVRNVSVPELANGLQRRMCRPWKRSPKLRKMQHRLPKHGRRRTAGRWHMAMRGRRMRGGVRGQSHVVHRWLLRRDEERRPLRQLQHVVRNGLVLRVKLRRHDQR
jgi:hypothetical protein